VSDLWKVSDPFRPGERVIALNHLEPGKSPVLDSLFPEFIPDRRISSKTLVVRFLLFLYAATHNSIPCRDCNKQYIGETVGSLVRNTQKNIKPMHVKIKRFDRSALTQHTFDLDHRMDWENAEELDF